MTQLSRNKREGGERERGTNTEGGMNRILEGGAGSWFGKSSDHQRLVYAKMNDKHHYDFVERKEWLKVTKRGLRPGSATNIKGRKD